MKLSSRITNARYVVFQCSGNNELKLLPGDLRIFVYALAKVGRNARCEPCLGLLLFAAFCCPRRHEAEVYLPAGQIRSFQAA